jgi:hypothetical protein
MTFTLGLVILEFSPNSKVEESMAECADRWTPPLSTALDSSSLSFSGIPGYNHD